MNSKEPSQDFRYSLIFEFQKFPLFYICVFMYVVACLYLSMYAGVCAHMEAREQLQVSSSETQFTS